MAPKSHAYGSRLKLTELPAGARGRVCALNCAPELCQRLREMGLGETSFVTRLSGTKTVLCQLCGTRIALSSQAAENIVVEWVPS